jgi:DNA repair protein RecO (recombination protein O)
MEQREEEAIVLDCRASGERGKLVLLLGETGQLVHAYAAGAAGSRRRFGGALEPGSRVRARWVVPREGGFTRLEEAVLEQPPPPPGPVDRLYATAHLVELARIFAQQGQEDPRVFRLVRSCLDALAGVDDVDPVLRYAEVWMLRLAGLWPDLEQCAVCGAALERRGRFVTLDTGACCARHRAEPSRALDEGAAHWTHVSERLAPARMPPLDVRSKAALVRLTRQLITGFSDLPLTTLDALERLRRGAPGRRRSG